MPELLGSKRCTMPSTQALTAAAAAWGSGGELTAGLTALGPHEVKPMAE